MRSLTDEEKKLIQCLLAVAGIQNIELDKINVIPMDDGGMGSLYFVKSDKLRGNRRMGKCIVEKQFYDEDGIPILISVNTDEQGDLFELDIWKADFSRVIKFPCC